VADCSAPLLRRLADDHRSSVQSGAASPLYADSEMREPDAGYSHVVSPRARIYGKIMANEQAFYCQDGEVIPLSMQTWCAFLSLSAPGSTASASAQRGHQA
jgi:hypothetical protein